MKLRNILIPLTVIFMAAMPLTSAASDEEAEETIDPASVGEDIIFQCDFDDGGLGKWGTFGGGAIAIDTSTAHSGEYCLKVTERTANFHGPSMNCDKMFNSGDSYKFDSWIYQENGTPETISWTMKYRDIYGTETYKQIANIDLESDVWTPLSGIITIPEDIASATMYFECSNATAEFSIDDIVISGNESSHSQNSEEYFLDDRKIDFEEGIEHWTARGSNKISHTDEYSHGGTFSVYVTDREKTWNGLTTMIENLVRKGDEYHYSAYVMYNGEEYGSSHIFRMEIQYTLNGVDTYNLVSDKLIEKNKWTKIEGYYTIPVEAQNVSFYIQTDNVDDEAALTTDDLMSFYVDDVRIAKPEVIKSEKNRQTAIYVLVFCVLAALLIFAAVYIFRSIKKSNEALELVSYDAMTKVRNRNAYEERLKKLEEGEEYKSLHFALCDVNFLKYINDNCGHEKGDEAIIRCAHLLSKTIGKGGTVYRTGGDEFVCITTSSVKEAVLKAAAEESKTDKGYPFAVACGFASYDEKLCPTLKEIITQCDKKMYEHKQKIKAENAEFSRK